VSGETADTVPDRAIALVEKGLDGPHLIWDEVAPFTRWHGERTGDDVCHLGALKFDGYRVAWGDVDSDDEKEAVVELRWISETVGHGERCEVYWLGVFEDPGGTPELKASLRTETFYCAFDAVGRALTWELEDGALWIQTQEVSACGTRIDFDYEKHGYRWADGALATDEGSSPGGTHYDRTPGPSGPDFM